ncbi:MAG TPA: DEAD/DEAH box helicase [Epulopiscium sp.]|nr:DEAD/DEAH box helicase [Candidatus Epulonipiscium sp.]
MKTFNELGLKEELINGLKAQNISQPTEIQDRAIPLILDNQDILGKSATGTGKTLAYLLPLFQKIDTSKREMQVLILTPTHELAMQVYDQVGILQKNSTMAVTSAVVIGNVNIKKQVVDLRDKQHIIIGSAGRILELIKMKKIKAHTLKTIVIDEFDSLLHKSNVKDIEDIIKTTLKDRQLLFFSASGSNDAIKTAQELSKDLKILEMKQENPLSNSIEHFYFKTKLRDKMELLRKVIHAAKPKKALIFINKSYDIEKTVEKLKFHGFLVAGIHGSDEKQNRKKALDGFREGNIQLLVASDVLARGLDVSDVTHIINLDMPESPKEYLHRVGRTGRAGAKGVAISLISNRRDEEVMNKCGKELKIVMVEKDLYEGKIIDNK